MAPAQVMEAAPASYRIEFESIRAIDDKRTRLIEKLLGDLERKEAALEQAELDLENEKEARRRLQYDATLIKEEAGLWKKRPFVVLLIDADADGYVFQDRFITDGANGGAAAADALLGELQRFVEELELEHCPGGVDIFVRAFANVSGLATALVRDGRLRQEVQLRTFAAEFSNRQPFFDFVDVGNGKERADQKIRENFKFFVDSPQCRHILLACCHDSGYAPVLGQYVADRSVLGRVTLVEGSPLPARISSLPFKRMRLTSVFTQGVGGDSGQSGSGSAAPRQSSSMSTTAAFLAGGGRRPTPQSYVSPLVQSERLGPVLKDVAGKRYDRPLQVSDAAVDTMRNAHLCYYLYLRGECSLRTDTCTRNHRWAAPLTDEHFDALWSIVRHKPCFQEKRSKNGQPGCCDEKCFYSHGTRDVQNAAASSA